MLTRDGTDWCGRRDSCTAALCRSSQRSPENTIFSLHLLPTTVETIPSSAMLFLQTLVVLRPETHGVVLLSSSKTAAPATSSLKHLLLLYSLALPSLCRPSKDVLEASANSAFPCASPSTLERTPPPEVLIQPTSQAPPQQYLRKHSAASQILRLSAEKKLRHQKNGGFVLIYGYLKSLIPKILPNPARLRDAAEDGNQQ